jgi:hypothetical protein
MSPSTIYAVGMGVSALGSILAGIGRQEEGELAAFNMDTEKTLNNAQALEVINARRREYDLATESNIATFYKGGDATASRSVQAFLEASKETFAKDASSVANQTFRENLKLEQAKLAEKRRGSNALIASFFDAASTAAEGYVGYQRVKLDLD